MGMMQMLDLYSITHTGRHHSGIDDVTNITEIVKSYLQNGGYPATTDIREYRAPKKRGGAKK
jgi:ERI1 exoribonuclease 3